MSKVPGLPEANDQQRSDEERFDEEPTEHVPGSFLSSLPQFFVFPLILVVTITAIYLLLRTLAGVDAPTAEQLITEVRTAPGEQSRWQAAHNLADALGKGRVALDEVPGDEVVGLYDDLAAEGPQLRSFLLAVLAHSDDPEATERVLTALDEATDPDVRIQALYALHMQADPAGVPALVEVLERPTRWEEQFVAIAALSSIGTREARDALAARLGEGSGLEHRNTVIALAQTGDPRAAEWLAPMLSRADYEADTSILGQDFSTLSESSRAAVRADVLEQFLVNACRAAEALGDPELIGPLQRLRETDPSTKVKGAAIQALHALDEHPDEP